MFLTSPEAVNKHHYLSSYSQTKHSTNLYYAMQNVYGQHEYHEECEQWISLSKECNERWSSGIWLNSENIYYLSRDSGLCLGHFIT